MSSSLVTANSNDVTESWGTYYGYITGFNPQSNGFNMQINKGNGSSTHGPYKWTSAGWYEFQLVYEGSDKATYPMVYTWRKGSGSNWCIQLFNNNFIH